MNEFPTFVVFTQDMLSYTLGKFGLAWSMQSPPGPFFRKFRPKFGDAVLCFRKRHRTEFQDQIARHQPSVLSCSKTFADYIFCFVERIFQGRAFLMEFLVYCAFLLDMAVFCYENDQPALVAQAVESVEFVYEQHMVPQFFVVGGWSSLYRVADQYSGYVAMKMEYTRKVQESEPHRESEPMEETDW